MNNQDWENYTKNIKKLECKPLVETSKKTPKIKIINKNNSKQIIENYDNIPISYSKYDSSLSKRNFIIERKLDMHGMTKNEAKLALIAFIDESISQNVKNVVIITGKGSRSQQNLYLESGVLRQEFPMWMKEKHLSNKISAFCVAKNKDGGNGAFYLRLKSLHKTIAQPII